jgi:hypothetical protein
MDRSGLIDVRDALIAAIERKGDWIAGLQDALEIVEEDLIND